MSADAGFLMQVADFMESHGRDDGGYSEATRADFKADAERLRRLSAHLPELMAAPRLSPVTLRDFRETLDWAVDEIEDGRGGEVGGTLTLKRMREYFVAIEAARSSRPLGETK